MGKVRISFIGCGDHANRYIYPSLANVPGTELTAVCSLDAAEAEVNRQRHGAERAYTDYRTMIEAEKPDAAIIVGPPRLHYEAGLYCLERHLPFYAVHPVNLAASFLGDITEIVPDVIFSGENLLVEIKLKDRDGKRLNVVLHTFVAPGYGNLQFATELFFERRGMIFTDAFSALDYYPPEPVANYLEAGNGNALRWQFGTFGNNNVKMGYETEIAAFIESVRTGAKPCTDLADGLKTMQILTASFNQLTEALAKPTVAIR